MFADVLLNEIITSTNDVHELISQQLRTLSGSYRKQADDLHNIIQQCIVYENLATSYGFFRLNLLMIAFEQRTRLH